MIQSINFNSKESKIIVTLNDNTYQVYTDAESYLIDYPDRVDDVYIFQPQISKPIVPPTSLTMKQARLALLDAGYLDVIEASMLTMPRESQIAWEFATTVDRTDPLTLSLAQSLGLDEIALDNLFIIGSKF